MRHSRTIVDPCYPVFRYDGLPVSQSLYEQYVASHCEELRDNGDVHERRGEDDNLQTRSLPSDLMNAKLSINNNRNSSVMKDAREGTLFKSWIKNSKFFFNVKRISNFGKKIITNSYSNSSVYSVFETYLKHLF